MIFLKYLILIVLSISACAYAAPFCVAHRGNNVSELENSKAAIISAAELGVGGIEFDIQHSKDKVALVMHDNNLERVVKKSTGCPVDIDIKNLSFNTIREKCELLNGEKIPSLEDVLIMLKHYSSKLIIEFKDMPQVVDMLLINKYYHDELDRIIFLSFKVKHLQKIVKWRKTLHFLKDTKVIHLKKVLSTRYRGFDGLNARFMFKFNVRRLQKKGKLVGAYTKSSARKVRKYLRKGVDFITTNNPKQCMEELILFNSSSDNFNKSI